MFCAGLHHRRHAGQAAAAIAPEVARVDQQAVAHVGQIREPTAGEGWHAKRSRRCSTESVNVQEWILV